MRRGAWLLATAGWPLGTDRRGGCSLGWVRAIPISGRSARAARIISRPIRATPRRTSLKSDSSNANLERATLPARPGASHGPRWPRAMWYSHRAGAAAQCVLEGVESLRGNYEHLLFGFRGWPVATTPVHWGDDTGRDAGRIQTVPSSVRPRGHRHRLAVAGARPACPDPPSQAGIRTCDSIPGTQSGNSRIRPKRRTRSVEKSDCTAEGQPEDQMAGCWRAAAAGWRVRCVPPYRLAIARRP